jgi:hypothetical protein
MSKLNSKYIKTIISDSLKSKDFYDKFFTIFLNFEKEFTLSNHLSEEEEYVKNAWSYLIDSSNWKRESKSKINKKYKDVLNAQSYLSLQDNNLYNIFLNDESFGKDCIQRIFSYYNGLYNIKFSIISNKEDTEIIMWNFIKV